MGSVPFAFSVHHFIDSVGADAGFASIIGLAILILLYFAHARETASLREQLYEWAQRVQQLEARITQLSRQQASVGTPAAQQTPAPQRAAPAEASATAPKGAPAAAPVPARGTAGAPAGVAAPALTAATKLIPTGEAEVTAVAPPPPAQSPVEATAVAAPPPVTVAGGANGSSREREPVAAGPAAAGTTAAPPPPRIDIRHGATAPRRRPPPPPRGQPQRGGPSRGRRALIVLLVGLVLVAAVGGLLLLTSGGSGTKSNAANTSARSKHAATSHHRSGAAPVTRASVTVAVLNGTATSGLAGRVSQKLVADGFKAGKVATAADQTRTATVVEYVPGHKGDALAVASTLKLGPPSVQAIDPGTQAVACPPPGACSADVVVTLGTDLANAQ